MEPKVEEKKKSNTFSSLLKKVSDPSGNKNSSTGIKTSSSTKDSGDGETKQGVFATGARYYCTALLLLFDIDVCVMLLTLWSCFSVSVGSKKSTKARVKWADHFGGNLMAAQVIDSVDTPSDGAKPEEASVSWTDRKKRDRLREKELLAKAKYVVLSTVLTGALMMFNASVFLLSNSFRFISLEKQSFLTTTRRILSLSAE
mgnify:CR=1 FL=1